MGLTNAPVIFQTMMNNVLAGYNGVFCLVYLNDILVFSQNMKEHEKHLKKVLKCLREHKLFVKPLKCEFAVRNLQFCNHIVRDEVLHLISVKIKVITAWL